MYDETNSKQTTDDAGCRGTRGVARRTRTLNRLLSATALGLFLEGCGGGGDGSEAVPPNTLSYAGITDSNGVVVNIAQSLYPSGFEASEGVVLEGDVATGGVANVIGSRYADTLVGDDQANRLTGGRGDDTLDGGGGGAADEYVFNAGDGKDTILTNSVGVNNLIFTEGGSSGHFNFFVKGDDLVITVHSDDEPGGGVDNHNEGRGEEGGGDSIESEVVLKDLLGDVTYSSASVGSLVPSFFFHYGNADSPTLAGRVLLGGQGTDELTGGDERDVLIGKGGSDTMRGGTGNDFLYGGAGDDTMRGGGDNDEYWFKIGVQDTDTIADNKVTDSGDKNEIILAGNQATDFDAISAVKNGDDLEIIPFADQRVIVKNFYASGNSGVRDMFSIYSYNIDSGDTTEITPTLGVFNL